MNPEITRLRRAMWAVGNALLAANPIWWVVIASFALASVVVWTVALS